jgi:predicted transcriptional regulator
MTYKINLRSQLNRQLIQAVEVLQPVSESELAYVMEPADVEHVKRTLWHMLRSGFLAVDTEGNLCLVEA